MTGGGDGETTPMPMNPDPPDPPADNPPPSAPLFSAINSLNSVQRLPAINAVANTENDSITQSTEAQDSVSAVTDSSDNLMFHVVNEERVAVMVDNPDADWTGTNAPPLSTFSYIFDKDTGASKTLANYNDGDFYAVTGFWYRDSSDFGVFVDGSPRTVDLPTTRSADARYRGNVGGSYWGYVAGSGNTDAPSISGNFIGNINLRASIPAGSSNNTTLNGTINIPAVGNFPNINFEWIGIRDNNGNGIFTDTNMSICNFGCSDDATVDSFSARFVGDPVTNAADGADSGGFPAGIIGAFGIQGLPIGNPNVDIDILGFFGAIHENLCAATASDDSAAFC